jgi:hypothetical protein
MVSLLVPMPQIPRRDFSWIDGLYDGFQQGKQDALDSRTNDALTQAYDGVNGTAAPAGGVLSQLGQKAMQGLGITQATPPQPTVQSASLSSLAPQAMPTTQGGNPAYRNAIASIESAGSGDYAAVGPTHPKMGRALGRYQVMESNIGPWSEAALGRRVTSQEFLSSPQIQDAIFDHRFGGYVSKYGNPQDAASAWFTGQPQSRGGNRRDVLGTSGNQYVDKFNRAMGRSTPGPTSGTVTAAASPDEAGLASAQPVGADFRVPGIAAPERPQMQAAQYQPQALPGNVMPTPTLPPQAIRALLANPRTRQQGLSAWREQVGAPVDTEQRQFERSYQLDNRDYSRGRDQVQDQRFEQRRAWELQDAEQARTNRLEDYRTQKEIDQQYAGPGTPKLFDLYDEATGQPYKAQWNPQTGEFERVGGIKAPNGTTLSVGPDGQVSFTQGSGQTKLFTEGQSKDNVYATRARGSLPTADKYADQLGSFGDRLMDADPTGVIRGNFQSADYQVARTAADEFLQAILRKDTGAAITEPEQMLYGRTYFPVPGDGPEVRAYKAEARSRAVAAIESGMSAPQMVAQERALAKSRGIDLGGGGGEVREASVPANPSAVAPGVIESARQAISRGADPEAVRKRLRDNGIDPAQAGL